MSFMRNFLNLFNKTPAPTPIPEPPMPSPAPSATAPVAIIPVLPLLDSREWTQEVPGWLWEGTRIEFSGERHSTLRSPSRPIPASKKVMVAATMACDSWGDYKAKVQIAVSAYNARGNHVYSTPTQALSDGPNVVVADFPDTADHYFITIVGYIQYSGGTNDTQLLKPRLVNLCASDA